MAGLTYLYKMARVQFDMWRNRPRKGKAVEYGTNVSTPLMPE